MTALGETWSLQEKRAHLFGLIVYPPSIVAIPFPVRAKVSTLVFYHTGLIKERTGAHYQSVRGPLFVLSDPALLCRHVPPPQIPQGKQHEGHRIGQYSEHELWQLQLHLRGVGPHAQA